MTLDQLERCVLEFCISEVQRGLIWIETALHRERQLRSSWILCYFLDPWNTTNGSTCTVGLRVMFPQRSKQRLPGAVSTQENGVCVGHFSSYVLQTQFKLGPCVPGNWRHSRTHLFNQPENVLAENVTSSLRKTWTTISFQILLFFQRWVKKH